MTNLVSEFSKNQAVLLFQLLLAFQSQEKVAYYMLRWLQITFKFHLKSSLGKTAFPRLIPHRPLCSPGLEIEKFLGH